MMQQEKDLNKALISFTLDTPDSIDNVLSQLAERVNDCTSWTNFSLTGMNQPFYKKQQRFPEEKIKQLALTLSAVLKKALNLQIVQISGIFWDDKHAALWIPSLYNCPQVQKLNLSDCELAKASAIALHVALLGLKSLNDLVLGGNRFNDEAVEVLLSDIHNNHPLQHLSLNGNPLGNKGLQKIASWLSLKPNRLPPVQLKYLLLSGCMIDDCKPLVDILASANNKVKLQKLFLDDNKLTDAQADVLSQLTSSVEELSCRGNLWTAAGITKLQNAKFKKMPIKILWQHLLEKAEDKQDLLEIYRVTSALASLNKLDYEAQEKKELIECRLRQVRDGFASQWNFHFTQVWQVALNSIKKPMYVGQPHALKAFKEFLETEFNFLARLDNIFTQLASFHPYISYALLKIFHPLPDIRWLFGKVEEITEGNFHIQIKKLYEIFEKGDFYQHYGKLIRFRNRYPDQIRSEFSRLCEEVSQDSELSSQFDKLDAFRKQLLGREETLMVANQRIPRYKLTFSEVRKLFNEKSFGSNTRETQTRLEIIGNTLEEYTSINDSRFLKDNKSIVDLLHEKKDSFRKIVEDPKQQKLKLQVLKLNPHYAYEAEDINRIIEYIFAAKPATQKIGIEKAYENRAIEDWKSFLLEAATKYINQYVLFPFHMGEEHWAGFVIYFKPNAPKAIWLDPLNSLQGKMRFTNLFENLFPKGKLESCNLNCNEESKNSAVIIIEAFSYLFDILVKVREEDNLLPVPKNINLNPKDLNKWRIKHLQLLEDNSVNFFEIFYKKQSDYNAENKWESLPIETFETIQLTPEEENYVNQLLDSVEKIPSVALKKRLQKVFFYKEHYDEKRYFNHITINLTALLDQVYEKKGFTAAIMKPFEQFLALLFKTTVVNNKFDWEVLRKKYPSFAVMKSFGIQISLLSDKVEETKPSSSLNLLNQLKPVERKDTRKSFNLKMLMLVKEAKTKQQTLEAISTVEHLSLSNENYSYEILYKINKEEVEALSKQERIEIDIPNDQLTIDVPPVGKGHFGEVRLARVTAKKDKRVVYTAVKILTDAEKIEESKNEDKIHQILMKEGKPTPGIIPFFGSLERNQVFYQFTQLAGLGNLIRFNKTLKKALKAGQINQEDYMSYWTYITYRWLEALNHLHELGIYHNDVTPENLVINCWGQVDLIDFGNAYIKQGIFNSAETLEYHQGNRYFYSPKRYYFSSRPGSFDLEKSDVWGVGASLFFLFKEIYPIFTFKRISNEIKQWNPVPFDNYFGIFDELNNSTTDNLWDVIKQILVAEDEKRPRCQELLKHPAFQKLTWLNDPETRKLKFKLFPSNIFAKNLDEEVNETIEKEPTSMVSFETLLAKGKMQGIEGYQNAHLIIYDNLNDAQSLVSLLKENKIERMITTIHPELNSNNNAIKYAVNLNSADIEAVKSSKLPNISSLAFFNASPAKFEEDVEKFIEDMNRRYIEYKL